MRPVPSCGTKFVRTARCLPTFSGVRVRFSSDPLSWGNRSPATGWCLCNSFRAHSCPEKVPPGPVPVNPAVRHTPVLAHSFPSCSGGSGQAGQLPTTWKVTWSWPARWNLLWSSVDNIKANSWQVNDVVSRQVVGFLFKVDN